MTYDKTQFWKLTLSFALYILQNRKKSPHIHERERNHHIFMREKEISSYPWEKWEISTMRLNPASNRYPEPPFPSTVTKNQVIRQEHLTPVVAHCQLWGYWWSVSGCRSHHLAGAGAPRDHGEIHVHSGLPPQVCHHVSHCTPASSCQCCRDLRCVHLLSHILPRLQHDPHPPLHSLRRQD